MILSYGWTWPACCAEVKNCTRRHWQDDYAKRWHTGIQHEAVNRQKRFGGYTIARITLTRAPYQERTSLMTEADYRNEGMEYMDRIGFHPPKLKTMGFRTWLEFFEAWRKQDQLVWVVRTRKPIVTAQGQTDLADLLKRLKG